MTFNRNYDAALGRFIGVDPVAESAESMTSYQYAGNNPVMYNDPLGDKMMPPPPGGGPSIVLHNGVLNQLSRDMAQFNSAFAQASAAEGQIQDGGGDGIGGGDMFGQIFREIIDADHDANYNANINNQVAYQAHNYSDGLGSYIKFDYITGSHSGYSGQGNHDLDEEDIVNHTRRIYYGDASQGGGVQEWSVYNRHDDDLNENLYGMKFSTTVNIAAYAKYNFTTYNWISIVNRTPNATVGGVVLSNPITDGNIVNGTNTNYPYYMTSKDNYIFGNWIYFGDHPGMPYQNGSFSAVTTLVGINGNVATPILSYSWGYQVTNGVTTLSPASPTGPIPNIILKP